MAEESTDTAVTRTMESLIDEALKIIRNVSDKADHVFVNKNQCKWLARRFEKIGEALEVVKNDVTSSLEESAMGEILSVLKEGMRLVKSYKDNAAASALVRTVNREAFDEIDKKIDELKKYLSLSDPEKATEENPADKDQNSMIEDLGKLNLQDEEPNVVLSNLKSVVSDKIRQGTRNATPADSDAVPDDNLSYLHIEFDAIQLGPPIKKLPAELNEKDKHLEGQALVHKGQWNGCECAIKVFKSSDKAWNMEELRKEVASLVKLRHPHITQLIGRAQDGEKTYVLYEKMDGDLRKFMEDRKNKKKSSSGQTAKPRPFSPSEELSIIRQIAQGMFYLHQHGIVHGELKCTNLLVKRIGDDIDVKVSDFHCSRELGSNEKYKPTHRTRWLPPEAFDHPPNDIDDVLKQGDVYSFAMTCCEVVTGGYPFHGIDRNVVKEMILRDERPELPDHLKGSKLEGLIKKCWSKEPEKRPPFEEVCYILLNIVDLQMPVPRSNWRSFLCGGSSAAEVQPVYDKEDGRVSQVSKRRKEDIVKEWLQIFGESTSKIVQETVIEGLPHYLNIDPSNLERKEKLGKGASAEVWEATWIGCKFAVKWLSSDHVSKLRDEVDIMMKLLHPHVVRLVGFAVLAEANRCAIVMELMDESLEDFIKKMKNGARTPFSEAEAIVIITQLARGMNFMHSRGVAHGDLKCANVLVRHVQTKKNNMDIHVKLVDFGLAHLKSVVKHKSARVGACHAPEVLLGDQDYDPMPADVYSFGMMCCEIITGNIITAKLHRPKVKPSNMREELWKLLEDCWKGPLERPTFSQICNELAAMSPKEPWFKWPNQLTLK